jgi:hypothetical protein
VVVNRLGIKPREFVSISMITAENNGETDSSGQTSANSELRSTHISPQDQMFLTSFKLYCLFIDALSTSEYT